MIPVYSVAQVRAVEQEEISSRGSSVLMQQAASALTQCAIQMLEQHPANTDTLVVGLIGPGNNGGDGLYALAQLAGYGYATCAVLCADTAHEEALKAFKAHSAAEVLQLEQADQRLKDAALIIDAIYGIGYRPGAELPTLPAGSRVLACDVPSGLDLSTARADDRVLLAERTVTFGAMKDALISGDGPLVSGEVELAGLDFTTDSQTPSAHLVDEASAKELLSVHRSWRDAGRHKYERGVLGLIAGSALYPGAAQLTARAAVDGGVGLLRTHVPSEVQALVAQSVPESVPLDDDQIREALSLARRYLHGRGAKISAWAIGPGLDSRTPPTGVIADVFTSRQPAVIDASGLELVPIGPSVQPRVLTPHAKELRMLLKRAGVVVTADEISEDPARWTRWAALAYNAVVLLKGPTSYAVAPDGRTLMVCHASAQLATAGSGDVLTGILGRLLSDASLTGAQGLAPVSNNRLLELTACAAVIHGHLGRVTAAQGSVSASRLIANLPAVMGEFGL
ncbi:NAD(P)H-hydrate dehydratase [Glutamicibacter endophyticus]